jgi:hypothetical protein
MIGFTTLLGMPTIHWSHLNVKPPWKMTLGASGMAQGGLGSEVTEVYHGFINVYVMVLSMFSHIITNLSMFSHIITTMGHEFR